MAAEQRSGRLCQCGCGASIDNLHPSSKFTKVCAEQRYVERKRAFNLSRRSSISRRREHAKSAAEVKALNPHHRQVSNAYDPVKHVRQILCKVCFGMPWARRPDRFAEGLFDCPVATAHGFGLDRCRGCGEAYSPEPAPLPCSVIGSSAGTAAREGMLYGIAGAPVQGRASSAKYK